MRCPQTITMKTTTLITTRRKFTGSKGKTQIIIIITVTLVQVIAMNPSLLIDFHLKKKLSGTVVIEMESLSLFTVHGV